MLINFLFKHKIIYSMVYIEIHILLVLYEHFKDVGEVFYYLLTIARDLVCAEIKIKRITKSKNSITTVRVRRSTLK